MDEQSVPALRRVELMPLKQGDQEFYLLRDPQGIARQPLVLSPASAALLSFLDGQHSVADMQLALTRAGGQIVPRDELEAFVDQLDEELYLQSPRFADHEREFAESYASLPTRPARFAGEAYADQPDDLTRELSAFYAQADARGSGDAPRSGESPGQGETAGEATDAIAAPHIDLARGGAAYAHAYRQVWGAEVDRIVILGVCHAPARNPFVLTIKDFNTPLGTLETDRGLVSNLRDGLDWDPLEQQELHLAEHSIEFQLIMIQHALAEGRPPSDGPVERTPVILPVLCAVSPADFYETQSAGIGTDRRTGEFLSRLRDLLEETGQRTLLVAGIDLAHVGLRFGGPAPLTEASLTQLRARDLEMLDLVASGDRDAFVRNILGDADSRNICGFGALYSLLTIAPDLRGEVLAYDQAPDPDMSGAVSFTAMKFTRADHKPLI